LIAILFSFIYSTKNTNCFYYATQIQNSFSGYQRVKSAQDLYKWVSNDFLTTLMADPSEFNSSIRSTYANFGFYLSDASSFVVGYRILRQLRTMKSKLLTFSLTEKLGLLFKTDFLKYGSLEFFSSNIIFT
jgi:hypothetical protein